jgi:hypothetical protein
MTHVNTMLRGRSDQKLCMTAIEQAATGQSAAFAHISQATSAET